jgi:hypothetical protein
VLDERKWEFAGENMRWKDLVRNNQYAEKVFMTFLTYVSVAQNQAGASDYLDMVEEYDNCAYSQKMGDIYWCYIANCNTSGIRDLSNCYFPNTALPMIYMVNPYRVTTKPTKKPASYFDADDDLYMLKVMTAKEIVGSGSTSNDWQTASLTWYNDDGSLKNQILYSLYGYIRYNQRGNIVVVNNGAVENFNVTTTSAESNFGRLPAVRYILPFPEEAIARSNGVYKNYYGY